MVQRKGVLLCCIFFVSQVFPQLHKVLDNLTMPGINKWHIPGQVNLAIVFAEAGDDSWKIEVCN